MNLLERKISGSLVYDGNLLKLYKDEVILPNGKESAREWIDHPGAAAVLPLLGSGEEQRVIMVKQYRYPIGRETLEIPAGKLDPGETPLECARRELREETGYFGGELIPIGAFNTTPAFTNEVIHLFVAKDLQAGSAGTDEDEFINTQTFPVAELLDLIAQGRIMDAKTIISLLRAERLGLL